MMPSIDTGFDSIFLNIVVDTDFQELLWVVGQEPPMLFSTGAKNPTFHSWNVCLAIEL